MALALVAKAPKLQNQHRGSHQPDSDLAVDSSGLGDPGARARGRDVQQWPETESEVCLGGRGTELPVDGACREVVWDQDLKCQYELVLLVPTSPGPFATAGFLSRGEGPDQPSRLPGLALRMSPFCGRQSLINLI